jgi:hypothetical protein
MMVKHGWKKGWPEPKKALVREPKVPGLHTEKVPRLE